MNRDARFVECLSCGFSEFPVTCGACRKCASVGEKRELKKMKASGRKQVMARLLASGLLRPARATFTLRTDTNWCRRGTVYPGINGNRPLENRDDFNREIREKDLVECALRDIDRGDTSDNGDAKVQRQIDQLAERIAHA